MMGSWYAGNLRLSRQLCFFRSLAISLLAVSLAMAGDSTAENRRVFEFAASGVTFDTNFEGARRNEIVQGTDGEYRVVIRPENEPINDSAWYAFRVSAQTPRTVTIHFHSTHHDVFYAQSGEEPVWSTGFSRRWLEALAEQMPGYKVRQESNAGSRPLSKVWARKTMKVPAVIYEVGDNTDRKLIRRVARTSAEEMMRLLLEGCDDVAVGSGHARASAGSDLFFGLGVIGWQGVWLGPREGSSCPDR